MGVAVHIVCDVKLLKLLALHIDHANLKGIGDQLKGNAVFIFSHHLNAAGKLARTRVLLRLQSSVFIAV